MTAFKKLQFFSVLLALVLYGALGEPTPENVDWVEYLIAALLVFAAGSPGVYAVVSLFDRKSKHYEWALYAQIFALWGMSIPLLIGVLSGATIYEISRDLTAFIFFLLPLLYAHLFDPPRGYRRLFMYGVVFIGFAFSLRVLLPNIATFWQLPAGVALYLTITPAVLFAALYLMAASILRLTWRRGDVVINVSYGLLSFAAALVPLIAISFALQRASVAAIVIFILFSVWYVFFYRPETVLRLLIPLCAILLIMQPFFFDIFLRLELKHLQVGLNSRAEELQAILDLASKDIWRFLFGYGWGGLFENPAVGKMSVGYTHNLFSYYLFKTGFIGLCLLCLYIGSILIESIRIFKVNPLLGLAILLPLSISTFFYASHKAFSFGLLLLLISAITRRTALSAVEPREKLVYPNTIVKKTE